MDIKLKTMIKHKDTRGALIVFLKSSELAQKQQSFGQVYFVTFNKKGVVRGNHYHTKCQEWFGIISGRVRVVLEDIRTKKRSEIVLSANKNQYTRLEVGQYVAHAIQSITKTACLLSYADVEWQNKEDTHHYKLL